MSERVIVSMTSYPGRISNVGKSIYLLLNFQTRKPDEIHLWLAEPEFPNREKDLPQDLHAMLNVDNVFLHWLPKNTYAHKKHEYFKIANNNDCVFLFDDDVRYADDLIENCMKAHNTFPEAIIAYNLYSQHIYRGKKILYNDGVQLDWSKPRYDTRLCTQCMIPANLYPKEALEQNNQDIRDKICPVCDETWLDPFRVKHNIPIFHFKYGWGEDISSSASHYVGLCVYTHQKEENGYERRDNWLENVLNTFPEIKKIYQDRFGYLK